MFSSRERLQRRGRTLPLFGLANNADEDHKDEDDGKDDEDKSDVDNEDNATSSPTTSNKKCKYNAVMGIITPGDDDKKANLNMAKSYPYLSL